MSEFKDMLSEHIKRQIEQRLGEHILSYKQVGSGYVNRLYCIDLGSNQYVLKIYNPILPKDKILSSIKIQEYLAGKGISPDVIFYSLEPPIFMLQEYIAIQGVQNLHSYGELLGKMHFYLAQYTGIPPKQYMPNDYTLSVSQDDLSERQRELLKLKLLLCNKVNRLPELDRQIIHGDYHSGNVCCMGDTYNAIDFDESKIYFRVYDVVKVLIHLIRGVGFRQAYERARTFLDGYGVYVQLSIRELEGMLAVYAYTLGRDMACLDKVHYNFSETYLQERIALHTFLFNEFDRIQSFIGHLMFWQ